MSEVRTTPKRLVDLNPKWIETHGSGEVYGISYDCPCALPDCENGGRQVVPTKTNFIGKPTCADSLARGWDLSGTSFENITLAPSIHQVGHWHGWLRNGVLESC
jgi:hypothetical protein